MIDEILFSVKYAGLGKLLETAQAMRHARSPIRGYLITTCFWSLMEIGLIDELVEKNSVDLVSFCQSRGCDSTILGYVAQYLARLGYLERDNASVRFSAKGLRFWKETNGVLNIFRAYEPFFKNLTGLLKKQTYLKELKRSDENVAKGFRETGSRFSFPIMSKIIQEENSKGLIELGCGNIDLSLYIANQDPGIKFLGIDLDDRFLKQAEKTIQSHNLNGRVKLLKKDIFDLSPSDSDFSGFDTVSAIDLFHAYFYEGREKLLGLFKRLRETFKGKKFVISEVLLPDEGRMKYLSYPHVEHELFHNLHGQRTFAGRELENLLEEAGFQIKNVWRVRNLAARIFIKVSDT